MPDGIDLMEGLHAAIADADEALSQMCGLASKKADAEREYRVAKAKRILYERNRNNTPVTIVQDIVQGYEDIALKRTKRDCADAEYDACREALMLNKKKADIFRELIAREWSRSGEGV